MKVRDNNDVGSSLKYHRDPLHSLVLLLLLLEVRLLDVGQPETDKAFN